MKRDVNHLEPRLLLWSLIFLTLLGLACALSPSSLLVEAGLITPSPTPDPYSHYRAILQPWAASDIEAVGPLPEYHITARLNESQAELIGVAQISIPKPDTEIVLRLYPKLANYQGEMVVTGIQLNEMPITPSFLADGTALGLPVPPAPDDSVSNPAIVKLEFRTTVAGVPGQDSGDYTLFGWDGPILSLPGFYPTLAVKQEGQWVLDQPPRHADVLFNEVALYQLDLTLPQEMVVVSSGVTLNLIDNPDNSRTWQITGGPLRDMTVIAGPYEAVSETAAGAVVTSYYLPGDEVAGQTVLAQAAASLRLYSDLYGPYPYIKLDIVEAPLNVRGMEYSGLVLVGEDLYQQQRQFQAFLVAHEVGHQWWYSLVGNNPYQHPWLDEGLTEYGAFDYYRGVFGQPNAEDLLIGRWQIPFEVAAEGGVDGAIDQPAADFTPTNYELLVYAKSALFFNALREEVGSEVYQQILARYFTEYRYRVATPEDFLAIAQQVSMQDLSELRSEWLQ